MKNKQTFAFLGVDIRQLKMEFQWGREPHCMNFSVYLKGCFGELKMPKHKCPRKIMLEKNALEKKEQPCLAFWIIFTFAYGMQL